MYGKGVSFGDVSCQYYKNMHWSFSRCLCIISTRRYCDNVSISYKLFSFTWNTTLGTGTICIHFVIYIYHHKIEHSRAFSVNPLDLFSLASNQHVPYYHYSLANTLSIVMKTRLYNFTDATLPSCYQSTNSIHILRDTCLHNLP